jgi:arylsulfatase A-like enzyme
MSKDQQRLTRRQFIRRTLAGASAGLLAGCQDSNMLSGSKESHKKPNILFIIVDDLRPEMGCYGNPDINTPHFDAFAGESMLFANAYCQNASCAPSRASVMTGLRPASTRVWSLGDKFRETIPDVVTMPQYFHEQGYHTVSMGKIFHNHMPDRISFDEPDLKPTEYMTREMVDRDAESFYYDDALEAELAEVRKQRLARNPNAYADGWAYGRSTECSDAPDDAFYDGAQTNLALDTLKRLKRGNKPFYLALGYFRPHLPFVAPKKYWDLYDRDTLPAAPNPYLPKNSPPIAINSCYELKGCYDLEHVKHPAIEKLDETTARRLKHGYYASVSYVDACFGKLMKGLKALELDKNTIVVVWGDHGWKLGEHGSWCKQTNYAIDNKVPLLVYAPGMSTQGRTCERLTELVDLYPTLCDLAGVEIPPPLEGTSFAPLLEDPEQEWKKAAFCHYVQRPKVTLDNKCYMGYSMTTERYHYVQWHDWDNGAELAGEQIAVELYDHQVDPDENFNIAGHRRHSELVKQMGEQLGVGWRAARPDG